MRKKLLLVIVLSLFFVNLNAIAQEKPITANEAQNNAQKYEKFNPNKEIHPMRPHQNKTISKAQREKEMKKFDEMLAQRLNLTEEQKAKIEKDKKKNQKELQKIFAQMQKEQKEIRNVYLTGIPKYQADMRTSASKAKLALLAQKAKAIREENRKNFESVLTPEQKAEFEKIKQEMREKRAQRHKNAPHHHKN